MSEEKGFWKFFGEGCHEEANLEIMEKDWIVLELVDNIILAILLTTDPKTKNFFFII